MKYDIQALHIFQEVLKAIKEKSIYTQIGICKELRYANFSRFQELKIWMHGKYMPNKSLGKYWWPIDELYPNYQLEWAKKDRIAFLERIIEDLMCGE